MAHFGLDKTGCPTLNRISSRQAQHDSLGFVPEVVKAFSFLESDYGFERVTETPELVRYERGPFFVDVIYEVGVGVLIGRKRQLRDGPVGIWRQLRHEWGTDFPIEYLAELEGNPTELDPDRAVVTSAEQLAHHIGRLADLLRRYGRGLLTGNATSTARLPQSRGGGAVS